MTGAVAAAVPEPPLLFYADSRCGPTAAAPARGRAAVENSKVAVRCGPTAAAPPVVDWARPVFVKLPFALLVPLPATVARCGFPPVD